MPFRWHWRQDGGSFEPYPDMFNACIETAFDSFTRCGGTSAFTTPPLVRYVDDIPQRYHIDFAVNTQSNASTGYKRSIMRRKAGAAAHGRWQFFDGSMWRPYESLVQDVIEGAYRMYSDGIGAAAIDVHFPGRPEAYCISFVEGHQTNTCSGEKRPVRRLEGVVRLRPPAPPPYWRKQSGQFHELEYSGFVKSMAQDLLTKTHKTVRSKDRVGEVPVGFHVDEAWRIEDSDMWGRYARKCQAIQAKGVKNHVEVKTTPELAHAAQKIIGGGMNEVYLFHGTTLVSAMSIASTGFRINLAGSSVGTAFGKGAYFAERSVKSDEYARPEVTASGERCAMLLCRVCLGEVFRLEDFDPAGERHVLGSPVYDSLLGDREAKVKTFREFIVYDEDQVYPEYVILYRRRYSK